MAKELRGDLCIVATALKKVQERDGEIDPDIITNFLTAGMHYIAKLPSYIYAAQRVLPKVCKLS